MQQTRRTTIATALALSWAAASTTAFGDAFLDQIGITQLRSENPSLTGLGVTVAQPEATNVVKPVDQDNFEVNPTAADVTAPITYIPWNQTVSQSTFTPTLESTHADAVARFLAGNTNGVAPGLAEIQNFNANYYVLYVLQNVQLPAVTQVINQSFVEDPGGPYTVGVFDQVWDTYVSSYNYIIVSGAGNGGDVQPPATAYNVIAVGVYGGYSSVSQPGQRAKPDIVVQLPPGYLYTSYGAPVVSGAAAILVQASNGEGDGVDPRTIKALLLNGAVKPADWTHSATVPLDRRYGAGLLNVANSYHNLFPNGLTSGEQTASATTSTASLGAAHLPVGVSGTVGLAGWNLSMLSSTAHSDGVDHYLLDTTTAGVPSILTATLVWQRAGNTDLTNEIISASATTSSFTTALNSINNLDLYLYNATTQALVDQSTSTIDNVEHLYTLNLNPGRYDLQVLKNGGIIDMVNAGPGTVFSHSEIYALAWSVSSITDVSAVTDYSNLVFSQANALTVGAAISGAGTLTQAGTGTTTLTGAYSATGPVHVAAGRLAFGSTAGARQTPAVVLSLNTLTIASNATLDVTNHDLLLTGTTLAAVETALLAGAGVGPAGTPAITTSTALSPRRMFLVPVGADSWLGHGDSAVGLTFDGVTIAQPGTVLVKYTFIGDLNLDGKVDGLDFGLAQSHLNQTTPGKADISLSWLAGDVTFNGTVDALDLATMAANLGAGYNLGVLDPQFIPVGASLPVPEPGSLLGLGMGAGLLLVRRRVRERGGGRQRP